jgi:hypothetical protein
MRESVVAVVMVLKVMLEELVAEAISYRTAFIIV